MTIGGIVSVALSLASRRVGVTHFLLRRQEGYTLSLSKGVRTFLPPPQWLSRWAGSNHLAYLDALEYILLRKKVKSGIEKSMRKWYD